MYAFVAQVALVWFLDLKPSAAEMGEMTAPLLGAWRVLDIVDGPASSRGDKDALQDLTVHITGKWLIVTGGEQKEEYLIVGINPTPGTPTIDLRDARHRTYRGIYQREGKRLRICVQFWTQGGATRSVRPESFQEADPTKVFGPTLFFLEQE
jgi:uncharacterized protein (TIGR03067 family)